MKKSILGVLKWIILLMLAIVMLVPFFWLISSSLKDKTQFYSNPPVYFPIPMHFENFVNAWVNIGFFRAILNSLVFALTFTIIVVFSSALAAYGFSRFKFPGKKVLFVILLLSMMLPTQIMTIPLFLMFKKLNMINTILPMLLPYCLGVPYHIFSIRQFMNGIPKEVDEAAKIDGCGTMQIFFYIIGPMSKPTLIVSALLNFIWAWKDVWYSNIYLGRPERQTISVRLLSLIGDKSVEYGQMMAATVMMMLPVILLYFCAQKYFDEGITITELK